MLNKKRYIIIAIILFIFLGLTIFTFANPRDEETKEKDGKRNIEEKVNKKDKTNEDLEDGFNNSNKSVDNETTALRAIIGTQGMAVFIPSESQQIVDDLYEKALEAVKNAESTITQSDVDVAKDLVNKLDEGTQKEELNNRLKQVQEGIDVKALVKELENKTISAKNKDEMDKARDYRSDEEIARRVSDLSNDTLKNELDLKLNELAQLLDDEKAPELNVKDGKFYNSIVELKAEDKEGNGATITIKDSDGNTIDNITGEGVYTIIAEDDAYNSVSVTITIDTTAPVIEVYTYRNKKLEMNEDGNYYFNGDVKVYVTDDNIDTITKNEKTYTSGTKFGGSNNQNAEIVAKDKAGNETKIKVVFDKSAPKITGVENGKYYNTSVTPVITDKNIASVTLNGNPYDGNPISEDGEYTLVVMDKVGQKKTVTFTIDKTNPKAEIGGTTGSKYWKQPYEFTVKITEKNLDSVYYVWNKSNNDKSMNSALNSKSAIKVTEEDIIDNGDGTYSIKIQANKEGRYVFNLKVVDKAGNFLTKRKAWYQIDSTAASIQEFRIQKHSSYSKTKDATYVTTGDQVFITIKTSEELVNGPDLYIGDVKVGTAKKQNGENNKYVLYNVKLTKEMELKSGEKIPVTIKSMTDRAGKITEDIIKTENDEGNYYVIYDNIPITDYNVEYQIWNDKKIEDNENGITYVTAGSNVVAMAMYEEDPYDEPEITIAGIKAEVGNQSKTINGVNYYKYTGSVTLTEEMGLKSGEEVPFEIKAIDAAGNETVTKDINKGNKLVYDNMAPSLKVNDTILTPDTTGVSRIYTDKYTQKNGKKIYYAAFTAIDELSGVKEIKVKDTNKNQGFHMNAGYTYTITVVDNLGNTKSYKVDVVALTDDAIVNDLNNLKDGDVVTLPETTINGSIDIKADNITIVGNEDAKINGKINLEGDNVTLKNLNVTNSFQSVVASGNNLTIDGGTYSLFNIDTPEVNARQGEGTIKVENACNVHIHNATLHGGIALINLCGEADIADNNIILDYEGSTPLVGINITIEKQGNYTAQSLYEANKFEIKNSDYSYYVRIQKTDWADIDSIKISDYIEINTADEFRNLYKNTSDYKGKRIVLIDDIDLSSENWTPIQGDLNGTIIDGNGHSIKNMTIKEETMAGFIGFNASNVSIRNITFDNANVITTSNSNSYAGVVISKNYSKTTLENVDVINSRVENHWQSGGLVGFAEGNGPKFVNCSIKDSYVGGKDATAGTLFGLGIVDITVYGCTAENVRLYTDGLTWDSTQKANDNFWVGHLYGHLLTVTNSSETNVTVVSEDEAINNSLTQKAQTPNIEDDNIDEGSSSHESQEKTPSFDIVADEDGIVLEQFPYLLQKYSKTNSKGIFTDSKITVTSENDEEYNDFVENNNYKPKDVIWWAEFSCDANKCEGFNERGTNNKSNKIVEGRRGDISITMEAPTAKEGYKFVRWETYTANYGSMKIQGFEAIYEEETDTSFKDIIFNSLSDSFISALNSKLRF